MAERNGWETPPYDDTGCDWHTHSIFHRCQNGLSLREYLAPVVRAANPSTTPKETR